MRVAMYAYYLMFPDPPFAAPRPGMSVRLIGQVAIGRVEIFHGGHWLGLCMNSLGRNEAKAICHNASSKYVDGLPIVEKSAGFFGVGYSSSWITELACPGSGSGGSRGLTACSTIGWSSLPCKHAQPAVLCSGE